MTEITASVAAAGARLADPSQTQARNALPMQVRAASFAPASFDDSALTVDLVWSTGADVPRMDWWTGERYIERLSLDPKAVDLSRLNGGAPLLDNHNACEADDILGVVESATIEQGEGRARVRFSAREEVAPIIADVKAGIIRNVSVGYMVHVYQIEQRDDGPDIWTATSWTPCELSLVAIPADAGAQTRSSESLHPIQFTTTGGDAAGQLKERVMTTASSAPAAIPATSTPAPAVITDLPAAGTAELGQARSAPVAVLSQDYVTQVRAATAAASLPTDVAFDVIAQTADINEARRLILERAAEAQRTRNGGRPMGGPISSLVHDHTDPRQIRAAMADALAARAMGVAPEGQARDFAHHSMLDIAAECLRARGETVNPRDRYAVVEGIFSRSSAMMSSSDFALTLASASNKILLPAYAAAPKTYQSWAQKQTFNDFKAHNFIRLGDFPSLTSSTIKEGAETIYGQMSEKRELITATPYVSGLKLSRQVIINDDLNAFSQIGVMAGQRAAVDENALVYAVIANDGPTLVEGATALFSTAAGRLNKAASGTVINPTNIGAARAVIRAQTGIDGRLLNLDPNILICGVGKEAEALQQLALLTPAQTTQVNPYASRLQVIVDPNVSGTRWHLCVSPDQSPIVYGYLAGSPGPQLLTEVDFDTQCVKFRLSLDFGAGPRDYRGIYLNPGA